MDQQIKKSKLRNQLRMQISDLKLKRKSTSKSLQYNNLKEAQELYEKLNSDTNFQNAFMVQNHLSLLEYIKFVANLRKTLSIEKKPFRNI